MGTTGAGVAATLVFAAAMGLGSAARGGPCAVLLGDAPPARHASLGEGLAVRDPLHQLDHRAPLSVALGDANTLSRLRFLTARLDRTGGRLKIVLHRHDTRIYRSWIEEERSHFAAEEWNDPHRLVLEFADWQDEPPDVIAFGALTEAATTLLSESVLYRKHLDQTLDETLEYFRGKVAEWRRGNEADRRDADALEAILADRPKVRWQVEQTAQLRLAWMAKIYFYRQQLPRHPELAHVFGVPAATTLRHLADLEGALTNSDYGTREHAAMERHFEESFLAEFTRFYSQHAHYALEPAVIRAAWTAPQPRLLESSLVCPEMLLGCTLFP